MPPLDPAAPRTTAVPPTPRPRCAHCQDTGLRLVFAGGRHVALRQVVCTHPGYTTPGTVTPRRPGRAQA